MPNTGPEDYIHVVAALIPHPRNHNRIFISRRKKGQHLADLWEFPGGKLEPGEARFHGLRRELQEETGILVRAAHPFISVRHRYPDKRILLDVWRVTHYVGSPHAREDQETGWFSIDELDQMEFPEADLPVLQALQLPREILITPEVDPQHVDSYLEQFKRVMTQHPYRLVGFRAHGLEDRAYADVAADLQQLAAEANADIIIHRNKTQSIRSKLFESYRYRHLNSYQLHMLQKRPLGDDYQLSASCHDLEELNKAERFGCRFAYLSAVRATASHPGKPAKGWHRFAQLARSSRVPVYALGGVKRQDYAAACYQGALGVAGIRDFWSA